MADVLPSAHSDVTKYQARINDVVIAVTQCICLRIIYLSLGYVGPLVSCCFFFTTQCLCLSKTNTLNMQVLIYTQFPC